MTLERPYVDEKLDWITIYNIIPSAQQNTTVMEHSPFLNKLPDELRNRIYQLILVFDDEIIINTAILRGQRSILQVCKQTRDEASQIYYTKNAFRILPKHRQTIKPVMFFKMVGHRNAALITKLTITFRLTGKLIVLLRKAIKLSNNGIPKEKNRSYQKLRQNVISYAHDTGMGLNAARVRRECVVVEKPPPVLAEVEASTKYELEMFCANLFEVEVLKAFDSSIEMLKTLQAAREAA